MLLKLIFMLFAGFVQTDDFSIEVGDRFTVRTDGSNQYGNPDVRTIAVSPNGNEIAVSTVRSMMFIRPSDGEITQTRKESPFSIVYSADGSRVYSIGERGSKLIRVADKSEMATSLNRPNGYVGLQLGEKNGKIVVTQIDGGSPAEASDNFSVGSEVVGFADGLSNEIKSVIGQKLTDVYKKFDGTAGSEFRLTFIPKGKIEEEEITLKRKLISSTENGQTFSEFKPTTSNDTTLWCMSQGFHEIRSSVNGSFISSFSFRDFSGRSGTPSVSPDGKLFSWVARYKDARNAKTVLGDALNRTAKNGKKGNSDDSVVGMNSDSLGYSRGDEDFFGVEIRDVFSRELIATFPVAIDPRHNGGQVFRGVHLEPTNNWLVVATHTCLHVYNIETGKRLRVATFVPETDVISIYSSAVSGRLGAIGDANGVVRVVDLETGKTLETLRGREKDDITHMAFSKDGSVLSYHVDGVIHIVNLLKK